ncbi:hypothetical protein B9Z19DRAFT_1070742 [Tuber borchii]|uniref:Uncharacterized protein n=1 Tax=Tuber borchii TaxID=42251 RepID=A0A2T7A8X7_TUBBO|nr:hypothetical protein B9Z19DRAFT_1070742 [Tuber borchii]
MLKLRTHTSSDRESGMRDQTMTFLVAGHETMVMLTIRAVHSLSQLRSTSDPSSASKFTPYSLPDCRHPSHTTGSPAWSFFPGSLPGCFACTVGVMLRVAAEDTSQMRRFYGREF